MRFALRNLLGNYAVYALSIVSGIVLTPVIVHSIGKEGYGVWVFIGSITVFLRILDLGLAPTIVRYSAYYRGRRDPAAISEVASCGLSLYVGISLLVAVAGVVLALVLPSLEGLHGELVHPARVAALVVVLTLALELPFTTFSNLLKGQQRFDVVNAASVTSLLVYIALVAVVLRHRGSVADLAAIALAATVIRVAIPALVVRREIPHLRLSPRLVTRTRLRELTSFSGYAVIGNIAGKIIFSADAILIGIFLGPAAVAVYGVGSRLFTVASGLGTAGSDLMFPLYSELHGSGEQERQRWYLLTALRGSMCVVVLVTGPLLILPGWVIRAWLPGGFEASRAPLVLLAATLFFAQVTVVLGQYLLGRGRPRTFVLVQIGFGIANLVLTSVLLQVVGTVWVAALCTLVLEGCVGALAIPRVARSEGVAYASLARAWGRPVAAGVPAAAVTLVPAALLWHGSDSLPGILAVGACWTAAYAVSAWFLALGAPERSLVFRLLASRKTALHEDLDPQNHAT